MWKVSHINKPFIQKLHYIRMYPKTPDHDFQYPKIPDWLFFLKIYSIPDPNPKFLAIPEPDPSQSWKYIPAEPNARKNFVSSKIPTLPIPAPDLSWVAYLGLCIFCILPIQTFTFHFPKTNSDPLSRWPVSLWYRNNDVSPKTTGVEVGVWDGQGGATLMVCLTYENYCLILVSHLLNKS